MGDVPEQVFIDAAEAALRVCEHDVTADSFRAAVASAYRAGQAATPDGPRTWALPDEPGPEVTALNDAEGWDWKRRPDGGWCHVNRLLAHTHYQWDELLYEREGPLTDVTPAADGQDGDGHDG